MEKFYISVFYFIIENFYLTSDDVYGRITTKNRNEVLKMKFRVLDEMAHDRADIMIKCQSLGELFIEHFHKIYSEGKGSSDFVHHCHEMQVWLD